METSNETALVRLVDNMCQICGHLKAHHFKTLEAIEYVTPCTHNIGVHGGTFDCKCASYCADFSPSPGSLNGLTCRCGQTVFEHRSVLNRLKAALWTSQPTRLQHLGEKDVPYKVIHGGSKVCCLWTVHHHMRTVEDAIDLRPGYAIECPICARLGRMVVVPDKFVLGPTWKWEYKRQ